MSIGNPTVIQAARNFDSGAIVIPGTSAWTLACRLISRGRKVILRGDVGPNALTGLKISLGAQFDGPHYDILVNGDFAAGNNTQILRGCFPTTPNTTAGAGSFLMILDAIAAEIGVWAEASIATTLEITGSAFNITD